MFKHAEFTFHGSLNHFLPPEDINSKINYSFMGNPATKDAIEAIGVPHPEVRGIYVNEAPVDFLYKLQPGDKAEVFPAGYEDRQTVNYFSEYPLHFILDVHLGKLAKDLRTLGFDSLYDNSYADSTIATIAGNEMRIVLTRDKGLLKNNKIKRGYWLRSQDPDVQLPEVIKYFDLIDKIKPFTRCRICNGKIIQVPKEKVEDYLPDKTKKHFDQFFQCQKCSRVYWKGSHFDKMLRFVEKVRKENI